MFAALSSKYFFIVRSVLQRWRPETPRPYLEDLRVSVEERESAGRLFSRLEASGPTKDASTYLT